MKKKGFTLVELIVVLVILAILAALLIPALTCYIDPANEETLQATTRQVVGAAQTVGSEAYAENPDFEYNSLMAINNGTNATFSVDTINRINMGEVCELAEVAKNLTKTAKNYPGTTSKGNPFVYEGFEYQGQLGGGISWILIEFDAKGKVTKVQVATASKTCTYDGATGDYTVAKS